MLNGPMLNNILLSYGLEPIAIISLTFILTFFFYIIIQSRKFSLLCLKVFNIRHANIFCIYLQRLIGFTLFGLVPYIVLVYLYDNSIFDFGLNLNHFGISLIWTIGLSLPIVYMNSIVCKRNSIQKIYPQIRNNKWGKRLVITSAMSWVLYLVGYEFLFRGALFFTLINFYSIVPAIIINTLVYSITHIPKGWGETLGALPLGALLCIATYTTGSIFTAVAVHCVLALSNEWFTIKHNPKMYFTA